MNDSRLRQFVSHLGTSGTVVGQSQKNQNEYSVGASSVQDAVVELKKKHIPDSPPAERMELAATARDIYRLVLDDEQSIAAVVARHSLMPK